MKTSIYSRGGYIMAYCQPAFRNEMQFAPNRSQNFRAAPGVIACVGVSHRNLPVASETVQAAIGHGPLVDEN